MWMYPPKQGASVAMRHNRKTLLCTVRASLRSHGESPMSRSDGRLLRLVGPRLVRGPAPGSPNPRDATARFCKLNETRKPTPLLTRPLSPGPPNKTAR